MVDERNPRDANDDGRHTGPSRRDLKPGCRPCLSQPAPTNKSSLSFTHIMFYYYYYSVSASNAYPLPVINHLSCYHRR